MSLLCYHLIMLNRNKVFRTSKIFELTEASLVAATVLCATATSAAAIITGSETFDINTFILSVQPPYESDDKRLYPEVLEEKKLYPGKELEYDE